MKQVILDKAEAILAQRNEEAAKQRAERTYEDTCLEASICPECGEPLKRLFSLGDTRVGCTSCSYVCGDRVGAPAYAFGTIVMLILIMYLVAHYG